MFQIDFANIGHISLYLALILSLISLYRAIANDYEKNQLWLSLMILFSSLISLLCLICCFVKSDFTVLSVIKHSNLNKPLIYKIGAAWGHHEGSLLLWVISLNIFTSLFIWLNYRSSPSIEVIKFTNLTTAIQALLSVFFIVFILYTSNPFARIFPPSIDGYGLNPILQDIGLTMHPPMLYMGYVGFSIVYSGATAKLLCNINSQRWAMLMKPWLVLSWSFLTLGIALGSWWAYRELGWGGFWFWDPVENVALMPWIIGTTLIHALMECARIGSNDHWSILLSILAFTFSMIGTFIVRSGLITSVHSFALDPERGIWILSFIAISTGFSLLLYSIKFSYKMRSQFDFRGILLWFNHLISIFMTCGVAFGTLYPALVDAMDLEMISVGPQYYNSILKFFIVPFIMICCLASSGISLNTTQDIKRFWVRQRVAIYCAIAFTLLIAKIFHIQFILLNIILMMSIWLLLILIMHIVEKKPKASGHVWGMLFAHMGFAVMVFAITLNTILDQQTNLKIKIDEEYNVFGINFIAEDIYAYKSENYIAQALKVHLLDHESYVYPEIRFFPINNQQTFEASIYHYILYDIYFVISEIQDNEITVRIHKKPLMSLIWMSALLLVCGGFIVFSRSCYVANK